MKSETYYKPPPFFLFNHDYTRIIFYCQEIFSRLSEKYLIFLEKYSIIVLVYR
nr:MAG TPA: hypothetical protein [Caudoviricetes sp.]